MRSSWKMTVSIRSISMRLSIGIKMVGSETRHDTCYGAFINLLVFTKIVIIIIWRVRMKHRFHQMESFSKKKVKCMFNGVQCWTSFYICFACGDEILSFITIWYIMINASECRFKSTSYNDWFISDYNFSFFSRKRIKMCFFEIVTLE